MSKRIFSIDHKVIGKQFLFLGLTFLAVGGIMAMLIRWQLARPGAPVPVIGRPVYVKLRSKDVVHSFYLPGFRTKIDAVPGSTTRLWFQAQEAGRHEIGCAQHCGVSHYKMRGWLIATPEDEYRSWLARAETDSRLRFDPADTAAQQEGWEW